MASCGANQHAEKIKNEGNTLYQKGQYRAATRKYSEAIKHDGKNVIYYANRAASNLALKEYLQASSDAKKATELDANYAKGWARLGSAKHALGLWEASADAWRKAAACLPPPEQFTDADKRLSLQFSEGLQKAEAALRGNWQPEMIGVSSEQAANALPWHRAEAMLEKLEKEKKMSSAFVIAFAYKEFKKGVDTMKGLSQQPTPSGKMAWVGKPDALVDISNGLMRDPRAFHIDCPDWFEKYNNQAIFECFFFNGWKDDDAKTIIKQLPNKVKKDGWEKTRQAVAVTIRAWTICGLFASSTGKPILAVQYHSRVLEVLEWGRRVWKDVPRDDRGCVFESSFIRGIQRLHVVAIHEALALKIKETPYTREQLMDLCCQLVAETEEDVNPSEQIDAGFALSFWSYPKAEALAIIGWCQIQNGLEAKDAATAMEAFAKARECYRDAIIRLPRDEEKAASFAWAALEACWFGNEKFGEMMFFVMWVQDMIPLIGEIWQHSPTAKPRDVQFTEATRFALGCAKGMVEKRFTETDIVKPISLKQRDKWPVPNTIYI